MNLKTSGCGRLDDPDMNAIFDRMLARERSLMEMRDSLGPHKDESAKLPELYADLDRLEQMLKTARRAQNLPRTVKAACAVFLVSMNLSMLIALMSPSDSGQYSLVAVIGIIALNIAVTWFDLCEVRQAENIAADGMELMRDVEHEIIHTRCQIRWIEHNQKAEKFKIGPVEHWAHILDDRTYPLRITRVEKRQMKADGVVAFYPSRRWETGTIHACGTINHEWKYPAGNFDGKIKFENGTIFVSSIAEKDTMWAMSGWESVNYNLGVGFAPRYVGKKFDTRKSSTDPFHSQGIVMDASDLGTGEGNKTTAKLRRLRYGLF